MYVPELKEKFYQLDIATKLQKHVCRSQKCDLCIREKLLIAGADRS